MNAHRVILVPGGASDVALACECGWSQRLDDGTAPFEAWVIERKHLVDVTEAASWPTS